VRQPQHSWLRQHSIPGPVTGGLIASVELTAIQLAGGLASPWSLLAGRVRAAQH